MTAKFVLSPGGTPIYDRDAYDHIDIFRGKLMDVLGVNLSTSMSDTYHIAFVKGFMRGVIENGRVYLTNQRLRSMTSSQRKWVKTKVEDGGVVFVNDQMVQEASSLKVDDNFDEHIVEECDMTFAQFVEMRVNQVSR